MVLGLLLVPAIGGYWFLTHFNYTRFQTVRDSGYHLLFRSALWGGLFYCAARGITIAVDAGAPRITDFWDERFPEPYVREVVVSLFLAFLLPYVFNWFYGSDKGAKKVARDGGDHIELLIAESIEDQKFVELSLRSRKSYIGLALESGVGISGQADVSLIPILSGYRDKDTQNLEIVIDYLPVIGEYIRDEFDGAEEDFRIVIPLAEVVSARLFDPELYGRFRVATSTVRKQRTARRRL